MFVTKERQPLHWAAFLGHLEVLKLLVARGADLGCKDRKGYGLLHTAAASGQIEVVKYLLRMGLRLMSPTLLETQLCTSPATWARMLWLSSW